MYTEFENNTKGWPGTPFSSRHTLLQVRRITDQDQDEAQIEITITDVMRSGRLFTKSGSLHLTPEQVEQFIVALKTDKRKEAHKTNNANRDAIKCATGCGNVATSFCGDSSGAPICDKFPECRGTADSNLLSGIPGPREAL